MLRLNATEKRLEDIIVEHTRLVKEYLEIYNAPDMDKRREEIMKRVDEIVFERRKLLGEVSVC